MFGCQVHDQCIDGETCSAGLMPLGVCEAPAPQCGDLFCELGEWEQTCPQDCAPGSCEPAAKGYVSCGDSTCEPGSFCEDPSTSTCTSGCASSINCGCDEVCVPRGVDYVGRCEGAEDRPPCGDGVCEDGESEVECPEDCQDWEEDCYTGCQLYFDQGCFDDDPEATNRCLSGCASADDEAREEFVQCAAVAAGALLCGESCLEMIGAGGP